MTDDNLLIASFHHFNVNPVSNIFIVFSCSLISTYGCYFSVVQFSFSPILVRKIWNVFSITLIVSCSLHLMGHMKEKVKVSMLNSSCEQPKVLIELLWPQPPDFQLLFTWCFMLNCSTNGTQTKVHISGDLVLCRNTTLTSILLPLELMISDLVLGPLSSL